MYDFIILFFNTDSGRRFGNQTRRSWQNSEHDGLLGSGAFPRPTGYAGSSVPKARGNGPYQLNRSNEPYQPPRPYKVLSTFYLLSVEISYLSTLFPPVRLFSALAGNIFYFF